MILVRVVCRVCRALLAEVADPAPPADGARWSDYVFVPVCQRHGGGHGIKAGWAASQRRRGRPHDRVKTGDYIRWEELRADVEAARATRKTRVHPR